MRSFFIAALSLAAAGWPFPSRGAGLTPEQISRIDQLAGESLKRTGTPSISLAVVKDGVIVLAKAYGLSRLDPPEAATPATRYDVGSVAKQFTAAAVLLLAEDGRLSLDDPVGRFFPAATAASDVTLKQVLSHTAGYRNYWVLDYTPPFMRTAMSPRAIVDQWATQPLDFPPGSKWSYSNTGYTVAGAVVEQVSGTRLEAFLQTRVFKPLEMRSAGAFHPSVRQPADAQGYARFASAPPRRAEPPPIEWSFAAGGIGMTAEDLARWDLSVMSQSLLSPASYLAQQTEARLPDGSGTHYGLGVFLSTAGGHRVVQHNGIGVGFLAENRIYPDDRAAVVVLSNAEYGGRAQSELADGIQAILLGPPAPITGPPAPRPPFAAPLPLARKLYDQLRTGSLDRTLLTENANSFFTEAALKDYQESLSALGEPNRFRLAMSDKADGLDSSFHLVDWPGKKMVAIMRVRPDGKVEEFVIFPDD
jgi:CubicO group peptidase (beta-lactamase class C family)